MHDEKYVAREQSAAEGALSRVGPPYGPPGMMESLLLPSPRLERLHGHPLALDHVRMESAGFWQFVGSLNPLAQMRGYLADRHERKKDVEYRNDSERRRLFAEARLKELEVARAEVSVAAETYEAAARIVGTDDARKLAAHRPRKSDLDRHRLYRLIAGRKRVSRLARQPCEGSLRRYSAPRKARPRAKHDIAVEPAGTASAAANSVRRTLNRPRPPAWAVLWAVRSESPCYAR